MKQFQLFFLVLAISIVYFSACNDTAIDPSDINGTTADIRAMLSAENPEQIFTISNDGFEITTEFETIITGDPQTFVNLDGSPYNGSVLLSVTELQTKSDIIRYGYPTRTLNGEILTSDGEYLFEATGNGAELALAPGATLDLRIPNPEPSEEAQLFDLVEQRWSPQLDSTNVFIGEWGGDSDIEFGFGYITNLSSLAWVNVDYFTKFDQPLTDITVCLPSGYSQDNSLGFIVFPDRDVVLQSTTNLPIGETVVVVFITAEAEDRFSIAKQQVVIEANLKVDLTPESASKEEIIECLEDLN